MEIKRYAQILWHWLWLLVLGTVLGGATALAVSIFETPVYEASVTLLISQAPKSNLSDYTAVQVSNLLAQTYSQMLTVRPILEQVIVRLGLNTTPEALQKAISVEVVRDTQLIKVHVEGTSPQAAAAVANTLPVVFREHNQALQTGRFADSKKSLIDGIVQLDQQITDTQAQIKALGQPANADEQTKLDRLTIDLARLNENRTALFQSYQNVDLAETQSLPDVIVVEKADVPAIPVRPRTLVNTVLAAMVGCLLALGVAFLIEYLDDTIKGPDQVTALLNLPVIGVLDRLPNKDMSHEPITRVKPRSPTAEAFRSLRTNLQFTGLRQPLRRILVTSVGPGEGKSTVVANLAAVFAQAGKRVVVVDADLRRPMQEKLFDMPAAPGLSDLILLEPLRLDGVLQTIEAPNLSLLATGPLPPNPADLLGSQKMPAVLDLIKEQADLIILDSPPVSSVTDATILAGEVDGVILVVEVGRTRLGAVQHVKEQLERSGTKLLGVVLNKAPARRVGYYS